MTDLTWRQLDIRLYAVFASLIISGIVMAFPEAHTPNDDAYKYIRTAEIFLDQGFAAAFQYYSWASYAILIGLTSKLGIELFTAAHLINALFFAVLTYAFISIVREINPTPDVIAFAAIVILVYPQLNEYRGYVIRDIGFLALTLLALWQLLLYSRSGLMQYAAGFCGGMLMAMTLRPEALVYLLVTPLSLLFVSPAIDVVFRQRCIRLFLLITGICIVAGIIFAVLGVNVVTLLLEFVSVYKPFLVNAFNPDPSSSNAVATVIFGEYAAGFSKEYLTLFMATGLISVLFANLFAGIGGPYLLILLYGFWHNRIHCKREVIVPVFSFLLTNLVILLCFLFITRYLTSRYTLLFSLMLALLVPQILAHYWQSHMPSRRRVAPVLISLLLTYCAFDAYVSFGDNKQYVFEAIDWVQENTVESQALVTNNQAVAYFSGKVKQYDTVDAVLTAEELLDTNVDDVVVLEMYYALEQLLLQPDIASSFEPVMVLPDSSDQQLIILRRTRAP